MRSPTSSSRHQAMRRIGFSRSMLHTLGHALAARQVQRVTRLSAERSMRASSQSFNERGAMRSGCDRKSSLKAREKRLENAWQTSADFIRSAAGHCSRRVADEVVGRWGCTDTDVVALLDRAREKVRDTIVSAVSYVPPRVRAAQNDLAQRRPHIDQTFGAVFTSKERALSYLWQTAAHIRRGDCESRGSRWRIAATEAQAADLNGPLSRGFTMVTDPAGRWLKVVK